MNSARTYETTLLNAFIKKIFIKHLNKVISINEFYARLISHLAKFEEFFTLEGSVMGVPDRLSFLKFISSQV